MTLIWTSHYIYFYRIHRWVRGLHLKKIASTSYTRSVLDPQVSATHCNTHCNTLQHALQHALQHTLQHTLQHSRSDFVLTSYTGPVLVPQVAATHCIILQHTLQHTATRCNTMQNICFYFARSLRGCRKGLYDKLQHNATHTATHCSTHCNILNSTSRARSLLAPQIYICKCDCVCSRV